MYMFINFAIHLCKQLPLCYFEYIYDHSSNLITDNLNIAHDRQLKLSLSERPKYRSFSIIDWNECSNIIRNIFRATALNEKKKQKKLTTTIQTFVFNFSDEHTMQLTVVCNISINMNKTENKCYLMVTITKKFSDTI